PALFHTPAGNDTESPRLSIYSSLPIDRSLNEPPPGTGWNNQALRNSRPDRYRCRQGFPTLPKYGARSLYLERSPMLVENALSPAPIYLVSGKSSPGYRVRCRHPPACRQGDSTAMIC